MLHDGGRTPVALGQSRLKRIRDRSVVRIGFHEDRLPFSYFNAAGSLVGFDIDMAHQLAEELGVSIEFVPFKFDALVRQMEGDHFDVAMAGVYGTAEQSENIRVSDPYLFATIALVVPDHRDELATSAIIHRADDNITLGVHASLAGERSEILVRLKESCPEAKTVVLDSYRAFFEQEGSGKGVDALVTGASVPRPVPEHEPEHGGSQSCLVRRVTGSFALLETWTLKTLRFR